MATTADLLLAELEQAAKELLMQGEHDGTCTNAHQVRIAEQAMVKISPCRLHEAALKTRAERFRRALEQIRTLRDCFGSYDSI